MGKKRKNPAAVILGTLGGKAKSEKKTLANRIKARLYWAEVRARKLAAKKGLDTDKPAA